MLPLIGEFHSRFLYRLVASGNPLVRKTAVKLLLVFVEYTESNAGALVQAVAAVDQVRELYK